MKTIVRRCILLNRLLFLIVIALFPIYNVHSVRAQSGVEWENVGATVMFGERITFFATIQTAIPIQSVSIIILDESQGIRQIEPLNVQADGRTEFILDTKQTILRPFSNLKWSYQLTLSDGSSINSEIYSTRYADDRFSWQTVESGSLLVHWYHGDASFGQAALDAIQSGLGAVSKLVAIDLAQPIEFYIYANASDLRATLQDDANDWIAGHADPSLGVVMVVIEPGAEQRIMMEQRIPHELMHVIMSRAVGAGYQNIPTWFREGTATLVEIYPNPDYDRVLSEAAAKARLIPLRDLCSSFPADGGQAFVAYAESRSFTNYLHETYGSSGLLKLASTYADGLDCERGAELALGESLSSLEKRWRSAAFGQNAILAALQNMLPYLVLLGLVLIIPLIGIVSTRSKKGMHNEPEINARR
jgi:hypothetical protein